MRILCYSANIYDEILFLSMSGRISDVLGRPLILDYLVDLEGW